MKTRYQLGSKLKENRGVILILIAILMFVFLGIAALAIDIGYIAVTKNELQNVADSAALAATGELGDQYINEIYPLDTAKIRSVAKDMANMNKAAGKNISTLPDADITIGCWDGTTVDPSCAVPDAVSVLTRRDSSANGPIALIFAKIFGINTGDVSADATAVLGGPRTMEEGRLPIPVGIPRYRLESEYCNQPIEFHPTGTWEGCAGWHTYKSSPANANKLRDILDGLADKSFESPKTEAGVDEYAFIGGTVASAFPNMWALYQANKDEVSGEWETTVAVYDDEGEGCANPNKKKKIVGFATTIVKSVAGPPDKRIEAEVSCEVTVPARGGGGVFGTIGDIPGLVE